MIASLPRREKILVAVLAGIFVVFLGKFIFSRLHFPIRSEQGIFAEGMVGDIRSINPLFADFNDTDRDLALLVFSGLMKYDPSARNFLPDLAEKWERSRDGKTYSFTLRPNIFWHDGTPFSVNDLIFTFRDVIQDPGFRNPILKNAFEGVTVESPSPNTIRFTLPRANSYFISHLTTGIIPFHLLNETPIAALERSGFNQKPVGTGPYHLTSLKLSSDGDRADLETFPQYYGQKPTIERIRIYAFPNEKTLTEERGALHSISKIRAGSEIYTALTADERFTLTPYTLNQFTALFLNVDNPFLKEKPARQALAFSIEKDRLISQGEKRIDALDLETHADDTRFAFNPGEANKIFDSLGWKLGSNGFRANSKNEIFTLRLLALEKTPKTLLENIRNQLQNAGIQITIEQADISEFSHFVSERRYDLLLINQNLGYNRDVYPLFHSSQIPAASGTGDGQNFANFRSFRTDGITEAIRKEQNPQDKEKLLRQLTDVIIEETPVIFLSTPVYAYAFDKRMTATAPSHLDYHGDRLRLTPYLPFPNFPSL